LCGSGQKGNGRKRAIRRAKRKKGHMRFGKKGEKHRARRGEGEDTLIPAKHRITVLVKIGGKGNADGKSAKGGSANRGKNPKYGKGACVNPLGRRAGGGVHYDVNGKTI